MNRRGFLILLSAGTGFCLSAPQAISEGALLTANEIETLLSDKKITGDWNGTPYTQSFAATGHTLYAAKGSPPEAGRWRVNAETDRYESFWERSGWSSYAIERDGDALYWVDGAGVRHPFEVAAD